MPMIGNNINFNYMFEQILAMSNDHSISLKGLKGKSEMDNKLKIPKRIYEIEMESNDSNPKELGDKVLSIISPTIKVDPHSLVFEKVKESILGSHVLYQQHLDGKPVSGAWLRIDIDKQGKVFNILNSCIPDHFVSSIQKSDAKSLSEAEAQQIAKSSIGTTSESDIAVVSSELVYYHEQSVPILSWKIFLQTKNPIGDWKVYVKAEDGQLLKKINVLKLVNGSGRVFNPNPVVTLNDITLEDDSAIPENSYEEVSLIDLVGNGQLDGRFVSTKTTTNRVQSIGNNFRFSRADRGFKEVMVYFHIDRVQRYLQELGFGNVINRPISVNIDGRSDDNSHYSPATKDLTFGVGGVDDAEDAEVILHEYGHAIQDEIVPGWGESHEGSSMGEGFGDYLAASFFAELKPEVLRPTVANWDATFYSVANPPNLRRVDSTKLYPRDMVNEVHADGEIWSACLWEIRGKLGKRIADRLIIAHHFLLNRDAKFEDAAKALIATDKNLNNGRNENVIREVFVNRGILTRNNKRAGAAYEDLLR